MPSEKSPISYLIIISKFFKAQPDLTALEKKWNMPGFSGKFALDDYGSGMMIIAEGLETPVELEKVLELEVDLLQGYFLRSRLRFRCRQVKHPFLSSKAIGNSINKFIFNSAGGNVYPSFLPAD